MNRRKITKAFLLKCGWEEKAGVMVLFSNPRIGWKPDGTLIVGYHEWPEPVTEIRQLVHIMDDIFVFANENYAK